MDELTILAEITSIYKLRSYEVDLLNKIIEHFCKRTFTNTKPQFKFQRLVRTDMFYHFYFNIGGIDYHIAFPIKEIDDFLYFNNYRVNEIKIL